MWLEVSETNDEALRFYDALGYERVGETVGKEVVRGRFGFESEIVRRGLMRKRLEYKPSAVQAGGTAEEAQAAAGRGAVAI